MKRLFAMLLVVVIVCSFALTAWAETIKTGEIGANLRSAPSTSASIVKKIHQDEYLNVISRSGQWYYVRYGNLRGYVHAGNVTVVSGGTSGSSSNPFDNYPGNFSVDMKTQYMQYGGTPVEQFAAAGNIGCKIRSAMNVNDNTNIIHSAHQDEPLYLYCSFYNFGDLWYYAITQDGYEGYVHSNNVVLQYGW